MMMLKYYGIDLIIMAKSKYFQIILLPSRLDPCSIIMMVSEDCNTMKCNAVLMPVIIIDKWLKNAIVSSC